MPASSLWLCSSGILITRAGLGLLFRNEVRLTFWCLLYTLADQISIMIKVYVFLLRSGKERRCLPLLPHLAVSLLLFHEHQSMQTDWLSLGTQSYSILLWCNKVPHNRSILQHWYSMQLCDYIKFSLVLILWRNSNLSELTGVFWDFRGTCYQWLCQSYYEGCGLWISLYLICSILQYLLLM